jgi:hypothetical protein
MKWTRNSSLAARESAVILLTVLESPLRILIYLLYEIVNPINSKSAVGQKYIPPFLDPYRSIMMSASSYF